MTDDNLVDDARLRLRLAELRQFVEEIRMMRAEIRAVRELFERTMTDRECEREAAPGARIRLGGRRRVM